MQDPSLSQSLLLLAASSAPSCVLLLNMSMGVSLQRPKALRPASNRQVRILTTRWMHKGPPLMGGGPLKLLSISYPGCFFE